jgi:hypothetical protein
VPVPDVSEFDAEEETARVYLKPTAQDIPKSLDKHGLGTQTSVSNFSNAAEDENTHVMDREIRWHRKKVHQAFLSLNGG